jgi:hypothetical protein
VAGTNAKCQSSNETQSSKSKIYKKELLTLRPFGIHLTFGFWHLEFDWTLKQENIEVEM